MEERKRLIPEEMRLPAVFSIVCHAVAYNGTRLLTTARPHYDLSGGLDGKIPFAAWTVAIYLGCFAFWFVNYIIGCRQERKEAFRFMGADLIAKAVCMLCFLLLPTTNTRPFVAGGSVWEELVRFLYRMDAADNLFPSIHCLNSWFCFIAVRRNEKVPGWYRGASLLMALAVCISTLTTKQHVLADVFAGIALAEGSYLFVEKSGFAAWYGRRCLQKNLEKKEQSIV